MTCKNSSLLLLAFVSLMALSSAHAAEEKKANPAPVAKEEPKKKAVSESVVRQPKKEETPVTKWMDAENAMIDPLSDLDKESVFIMRQKYSVIRVIGVVERDIGNAVQACSKENPDMKDKISSRFDQWKNAVNPVIQTAEKNLNAEIDKQTIVDKGQFKRVLKLNDEAFEYSDKRTVKKPVSSKDACEALIVSMNDTEDNMIKMLQDTLLPPSVIKSRVEKQQKIEAEKKKSFAKERQ